MIQLMEITARGEKFVDMVASAMLALDSNYTFTSTPLKLFVTTKLAGDRRSLARCVCLLLCNHLLV